MCSQQHLNHKMQEASKEVRLLILKTVITKFQNISINLDHDIIECFLLTSDHFESKATAMVLT